MFFFRKHFRPSYVFLIKPAIGLGIHLNIYLIKIIFRCFTCQDLSTRLKKGYTTKEESDLWNEEDRKHRYDYCSARIWYESYRLMVAIQAKIGKFTHLSTLFDYMRSFTFPRNVRQLGAGKSKKLFKIL